MDDQILFRSPASHDATAMRLLAQGSQVLSVNSTYYYALMARHFQTTCMVAEGAASLCGYVIGYCPPEQADTLFVWQVGVARLSQGKGLGKRLLISLLQQKRPDFLEATIAPDNQPSINLFSSVARHFDTDHTFSEAPFFNEEDLGAGEKGEHLMRIGPFSYHS
ncbi:MAG: diaminobutyrate acetyltransferase [Proteobacteria bacterium]|nr:diaminobutyrate acetyltransferase [Desulfocapsa sp.]MBU3944674.1 diaminobutyrate acetyltransferase [Pseudomonadota bacterium]MCG2743275.1 diaminobutyrate acetyltransferase [Desulfobacteraceae bacterium]MBU4030321.1 diaminobutyrate acetyltransferase [Pseudomonadota bacterium]MBU4044091.1 diaminobutyrate acetyltransferase [Pseudomonadota bacterium]